MTRSARRFPIALDRVTPAPGVAPKGAPKVAPKAPPEVASKAVPNVALVRPQRPLREAADDERRARIPVGHGLDSEAVRARMVDRLRAQGVDDERVLGAMGAVPRHRFVDSALAAQAYEDTSLPIGWGQTISKPAVVARMIALLAAAPGARQRPIRAPLGRCLEVGTGCGYQAAVLARLSTRLTSIERLGPLLERARQTLSELALTDIRLLHADGARGHPPNAPFDSIVSAAGGEAVPQAWLDQLAVGGRLVAPVLGPDGEGQHLVVMDRTVDGFERRLHDAVHFVPLKSGLV